ncbi:MAG: methionine adenosyltransferase, partial [Candidatus Tantalella remota]|nr:methionine adenosyltransferase [Candidatus Tantalella remota]
MKSKYLFTSESVTEGHPDKVCDQISDSILDAIYKDDPSGRVACETMVTTGLAMVAGEITTSCYVDIPKVVRNTIKEIGYTSADYGFDYLTSGVVTSIQGQSPDIAMGVDPGGAGDQGMMFGYASNETRELMPMPITLAHALSRRLAKIRKEKLVEYLRPDGKSQVTVEYEGGKPQRVEAVVISAHHDAEVNMSDIHADMKKLVIDEIIPADLMDKDTKIYINPTGRFEVGGPHGDTGVTGRKIIVDTYGGVGSHGGGAFSGKDPTKVDRSASYMARYVAKNIVASKIADK